MKRRSFIQTVATGFGATGLGATGTMGFLPRLAAAAEGGGSRARRSCIVLWMGGAPSQMDTFDLKPESRQRW